MSLIHKLIKTTPHLRRSFERARHSRGRITTVYDISSSCNLRCDGCLFFDRDGNHAGSDQLPSTESFDALFKQERERGVNYPIFGGAEPGLNQTILLAASRSWSDGMVHTNGTIRFHPDIPFRLYVSCWGGPETTRRWRGGDSYATMMNNIADDERVVVNYTVNRSNIGDILPVTKACAERGVQITFQVYSPTSDYLHTLNENIGPHPFVHESSMRDNLIMRPTDDAVALQVIIKAIDLYPDTTLFTYDLADWVFGRSGMFDTSEIEAEVPLHCDVARDTRHRHHLTDMTLETRKTCGHPEIECRTCRTYTTIFTSYFRQKAARLDSEESIAEYLAAHEVFHKIFYLYCQEQRTVSF